MDYICISRSGTLPLMARSSSTYCSCLTLNRGCVLTLRPTVMALSIELTKPAVKLGARAQVVRGSDMLRRSHPRNCGRNQFAITRRQRCVMRKSRCADPCLPRRVVTLVSRFVTYSSNQGFIANFVRKRRISDHRVESATRPRPTPISDQVSRICSQVAPISY